MNSKWFPIVLGGLLLSGSSVLAQHLWWDLAGKNEGTCLYGEITVLATQPTTYYCGANWHPGEPAGGYCGIQHNSAEERRTIFSIWDTSPELHPKVTEAWPQTIFGRFGGEGEGGHTHMLWDWKTNQTFQFFVHKQPGADANTTDARYYIFDPAAKKWLHVATINSPNGGHPDVTTLGGGVNSFLENFSGRNRSAPRLAMYRLWLGPDVENMKCLTQAVGDGTWGELDDNYFLASGGTNELDAVFSNLKSEYGQPVFGGKKKRLSPITDRPLPASLIEQLKNLPRAASTETTTSESCEQPSPEAMAGAVGVTLPPQPWHLADIWWTLSQPIPHFTSLEEDVTIDRDVPATYNLYVSPCGIAEINGLSFYGGLQSNINGWLNATNHERIFPGHGGIFSRWSSDKKTPVGLDNVRVAGLDCLVESAGYEGEFASVRRPFAWTKGTYTYCIEKGATEIADGKTNTWFTCKIKSADGSVHEIGSLRFEGDDFTFWAKHSAFVEIYSTAKISRSNIPKVNVTFGWPRVNGEKVEVKRASVHYPHKPGESAAAPDCAQVAADGGNIRVAVGAIFVRPEAAHRQELSIHLTDDTATASNLTNSADAQAEPKIILTPKPGPEPRINGPLVYGCRPGHPFLYRIPCQGERPIKFSASGLPASLKLDAKTGIITGTVPGRGEYQVVFKAKNPHGKATRTFKIVSGDTLALTPPMGFNDWYAFYNRVTEAQMQRAADVLISSGMADVGYQYVNVDDCWMGKRDAAGNMTGNTNFPDMKALADYIHATGLKAGLYTSPGPMTCGGYTGSLGHEAQDARQFADWGFDFLKYDWCSYGQIASGTKDTPSLQAYQLPYRKMGALLEQQPRDMLFNLCQYGMGNVWEWGAEVGGQSWRTAGDLGFSLNRLFEVALQNSEYRAWSQPGAWNDPDYIQIGNIGDARGMGEPSPCPLTPTEQYSFMSLWCLMAAPLFYSGDINSLDEFTLNVLCNPEVIDVDQDPLGQSAAVARLTATTFLMVKDLADGGKAVGLCNQGKMAAHISVPWSVLGVKGKQIVRDLWREQDLGVYDRDFTAEVPGHGVVLVRVRPK